MNRPITETNVTIRGVAYQIRGDVDPAHLARLAEHVDGTMKILEGSAAAQSPTKLAIVASLTIADEFFQEKDARRDDWTEVGGRLTNLETLLDEALSSE
ncbi:MAG: cell division protein ZapA [Candidatus Eisenbacteria bacterium]|nr:cell division protein ZapA [Candidatus Eisenbacteria bacterium]